MSALGVGNWTDITAWVLLVTLVVYLALWDAGYLYRGRHRGVYPYPWWGLIKDVKSDTHKVSFTGTVMIRDYIPDGYGRFGDLDIDQADSAPLRPFLPDGSIGDLTGWHALGTLGELN